MIVVDTNVLAQLLLPHEEARIAEELVCVDDAWHAPPLWRSELRSVLVQRLRREALTFDEATQCFVDAEDLVGEGTREVDPLRVVELALASGCTAYDCEFVEVARSLGAPLVTRDLQLLAAFPDLAVTPEEFLDARGSA